MDFILHPSCGPLAARGWIRRRRAAGAALASRGSAWAARPSRGGHDQGRHLGWSKNGQSGLAGSTYQQRSGGWAGQQGVGGTARLGGWRLGLAEQRDRRRRRLGRCLGPRPAVRVRRPADHLRAGTGLRLAAPHSGQRTLDGRAGTILRPAPAPADGCGGGGCPSGGSRPSGCPAGGSCPTSRHRGATRYAHRNARGNAMCRSTAAGGRVAAAGGDDPGRPTAGDLRTTSLRVIGVARAVLCPTDAGRGRDAR